MARVSPRGAARWTDGLHPWIYRSDVREKPGSRAGAVDVVDARGRPIGTGLWSPHSTISLRMLTHEPRPVDAAFWAERIGRACALRDRLAPDATAYRVAHAEADGLPSLVVDRYGDYLVVQFLSAGLETFRREIVDALLSRLEPAGIIARDDVPVRRIERLGGEPTVVYGEVPAEVEVREGGVHWIAPLGGGQKTGAFLDQRENRIRAGTLARGRALDCFAYHGSFALHLARAGADVVAVDSSAEALARARHNAHLNGLEANIECVVANAFDLLREYDGRGERFDTIVLDPPAFAKHKGNVESALRGYKEINLRAMRLLASGGHLLTFSCSYHVGPDLFRGMLREAAADSGRTLRWVETRGQAPDHPEVVQIPESAYLKGAVLQAV